MSHQKLLFASCITLLLTGCGSGTTDQVLDSITPPALADGAGGPFYGYFLQSDNVIDPATNIGGLYLSLPNSEGNFSGRMSFQLTPCQRTNALSISGKKLTAYLKTGIISGSLDSLNINNLNPYFNGFFSGSYSRTDDNYSGTYNRNLVNGDDVKSTNCGNYTVADKGTWQVYKASQSFPSNFTVTKTEDLINWSFVVNADKALILIVDPTQVDTANNAFIRQIITPAATLTTVAATNVTRGQPYLAVVELFDVDNKPVAFKTLAVSF